MAHIHYKPRLNKEAGNKGAAVTGLSTGIAAIVTWAVHEFALDMSPEIQAALVTILATTAGYVVNRVRNWIKHT